MPVHNGSRWLAEAIESVLGQTFSDFELIVVDDGSEDETWSILEHYATKDPRIKPLRQTHLGLVAALNRCLAESAAPLFARLDSDDRADRGRFALQQQFLKADPKVGLLGSWARRIDGE